MIRIGIVGHRFLQQHEAGFAAGQCVHILKQLQAEHKNIVACSAVAAGADSIFSEAALLLKIPLEIVLPFDEYELDFTDKTARQTYLTLKAAASKITSLPFSTRSEEAYVEGMHWILKNAAIIIAVWNGEPNKGRGGTSDAVKNIISSGLDWIHIDISNYTTSVHVKKNIFRQIDAATDE